MLQFAESVITGKEHTMIQINLIEIFKTRSYTVQISTTSIYFDDCSSRGVCRHFKGEKYEKN